MLAKHKQTSFSRRVKIKNFTDLQYAIYTMTFFAAITIHQVAS